MADSSPTFSRLLELATQAYNTAHPTAQITSHDQAARIVTYALEQLLATYYANASSVTAPI
jgi:hypothetical protein